MTTYTEATTPYFILRDRVPVPVTSVQEWADWMDAHHLDCGVAWQQIGEHHFVSTVFKALDFMRVMFAEGEPKLFETAVFDLSNEVPQMLDGKLTRTWAEAEATQYEFVEKWAKELSYGTTSSNT